MAGATLIAKPELEEKRKAFCSQEEMVSLINAETGKHYGRTFYGNIETRTRPVKAEIALIIARILKAEVTDLFTGSEIL